jgi:cytochrome c-type protein NapB
MKQGIATVILLVLLGIVTGAAAQNIASLRGGAIDVEAEPPKMSRVDNSDVRRKRAYPMQPPTIPHKTTDYQVDLNANKCLSCHSRRRSDESQAPMVSVTHYQDRNGNFLADISARRYFCNQCHVTQNVVKALLANEFVDIDELLRADRK